MAQALEDIKLRAVRLSEKRIKDAQDELDEKEAEVKSVANRRRASVATEAEVTKEAK